jgi:hypothetical protein
MLIRRDGLLASPFPMAHDIVKLMSTKYPSSNGSVNLNPIQQHEAMKKEMAEKQQAELLAQAVGSAGKNVEWVARGWLTVNNSVGS